MIQGWMDVREAAKRLDVSVTAVHRLRGRGTLAGVMLGGRVMFRQETIDAYLRDPIAQARRPKVQS